jgi:hypothetical protein
MMQMELAHKNREIYELRVRIERHRFWIDFNMPFPAGAVGERRGSFADPTWNLTPCLTPWRR